MYTLTFTCKKLTGNTIHTKQIDDNSLEDTWDVYDVGETKNPILNALRAKIGNTHDMNVYFDTNDDGRDELRLCLYTMTVDEDGKIHTNHNDWITCEILSVKDPGLEVPEDIKHVGGDTGTDEFINDGEDYFYYNESWDKVECPCCERSCYLSDIERDDNGKVIGCADCGNEEE